MTALVPTRSSVEYDETQLRLDLPSVDDAIEVGCALARMHESIRWWVGDLIVYAENQFGDDFTQRMDEIPLSLKSQQNCAWLARTFPAERRRAGLSPSHHEVVAKLEESEQDAWLDKAAENGWTRQELRREVRGPSGDRHDQLEEAALQVWKHAAKDGDVYRVPVETMLGLARQLGVAE